MVIVLGIVAIGCIYLLWRGPNRRAFPCIKRKPKPPKVVEAVGDDYVQTGRGSANWRDTIVRKDAPFPVRKMSSGGYSGPSDMYSEKDLELQPQYTGGSVYSYQTYQTYQTGESKYTTPGSTRTSRASYSRRPASLGATSALNGGPEIIAPQAVYTNGLLGGQELFGLPAQTGAYSTMPPQGSTRRTPPFGMGPSVVPSEFGGGMPSNSALLSVNSVYTGGSSYSGPSSATSPPPAARRSSLVRKSTGSVLIPSPLGQVTSLPEESGGDNMYAGGGANVKPQRPGLGKTRSVSFVDATPAAGSSRQSVHSVRSNHSGHSRSQSSPPRKAAPRTSLQLPPGAQELRPPLPNMYARTMAASSDDAAMAFPSPRVSWNGQAYSVGGNQPYSPALYSPSGYPPYSPPLGTVGTPAEPVYQLPDGAYPANHPIALAHMKLSSASTTSLVSPPPPMPPATMPPMPALPPTTPPATTLGFGLAQSDASNSPPAGKSRVPTSPGYPSRYSRSPSASLHTAQEHQGSVQDHTVATSYLANDYAKTPLAAEQTEEMVDADSNSNASASENSTEYMDTTSGSGSGLSSPPSSTPPTSLSNHTYASASSSLVGHGPLSKGKRAHRKGHRKASSSSAGSPGSSRDGHSASSHSNSISHSVSSKRGLWFDSIDEMGNKNTPVVPPGAAAPVPRIS